MRFTDRQLTYLRGEAYSNGLLCQYEAGPDDRNFIARSDYLVEQVRGKRVLHLGCVDHDIASIENKISKGKWLHQRLHEAAERCVGIDMQAEGIDYLRDKLGYEAHVADVTRELPAELLAQAWDVVLLPEILEHIDNPVAFLELMRQRLSPVCDRMLITVPNAFHRPNFAFARKGIEAINTDHRYWFTPFTLGKVVMRAGIEIEHFTLCHHGRVKRRSVLKNAWYRRHPLARSSIIMHVRLGRP